MMQVAPSQTLIRILILAAVLLLPQIVRAMLRSKSRKPGGAVPQGRPSWADAIREAARRSAEQAQSRREQRSPQPPSTDVRREAQALKLSEPLNLPPAIQPEPVLLPSLLLLALLLCLGVMAYLYFAG